MIARYNMPSECGKYTRSSMRSFVPVPRAIDVLTKSPNPSIAQTAASSNGETKKLLARCAG